MSEDTATTLPRQFPRGALETLLLVVAAFPFAMWRAIPTSDSYGRSASLFVIGAMLPWHANRASPGLPT